MNLKYIDAHTHINFPEFEADRELIAGLVQELYQIAFWL